MWHCYFTAENLGGPKEFNFYTLKLLDHILKTKLKIIKCNSFTSSIGYFIFELFEDYRLY